MPAQLPPAADVQKAVAKVYQRPEYVERHGFGEWFWRQVGRAFGRVAEWLASFGSLRATNPVLYWAIVGGLVLAVAAGIAYLVWNAARRGRGEPCAWPARESCARPPPRSTRRCCCGWTR